MNMLLITVRHLLEKMFKVICELKTVISQDEEVSYVCIEALL